MYVQARLVVPEPLVLNFDIKIFEELEILDVPCLKIASTDITLCSVMYIIYGLQSIVGMHYFRQCLLMYNPLNLHIQRLTFTQ